MEHLSPAKQEFDHHARNYEATLDEGLRVTGEDSTFYAQQRVQWLTRRLRALHANPRRILDFGCGIGKASPILKQSFPQAHILGVDVSRESIERARALHGTEGAWFGTPDELDTQEKVDLTYCNGVFHHIPVNQRASAVSQAIGHLHPGGFFALWENNPWNPGTRWVMSRVAFDADAVMLWPRETRRLLRDAGMKVICTDFRFVFPGPLKKLRPLEDHLCRLPLGGQYMVLAQLPK